MKFQVRLLSVAENDLSEIITYVSADNASAGHELLNQFEQSFDLLGQNPKIGKIPNERQLKKLGYRYWVVSNYLVFYMIREHKIVVHRILHGARDYLELFR